MTAFGDHSGKRRVILVFVGFISVSPNRTYYFIRSTHLNILQCLQLTRFPLTYYVAPLVRCICG